MIHGGVESAQDLLDRISAHQSFGAFSEASGVGVVDPAKGWGYTAASLRGLGAQRTLVLLNGRRLAPYALSGASATDLSAIPVSALERVEVLKDGASAVYGTDAIGGVINFILRRDFRGVEAAADYLATEHGGGDSWRANITAGWGSYDRDGYNVFVFADHHQQDALKAAERESTRTAYRPDLSMDYTSPNSFPANISQPGRFTSRNPTIPVTGATPDSCLPPLSFPTQETPRLCRFDYALLIDAIPASDKTSVIGRFDYRLRSDDRFFVEAAYYHGYSIQHIAPNPINSNSTRTLMTLPPSSPYYPADFVRSVGGDRTDALYIILDGRVRAFVSDAEGREAVLSVMGPGEYFGEIAMDEGPRSASVITLEPCRMLVVPRADVADFLKGNPAFAMHFIQRLIGRIRTLTNNVRSLALMDAYGRVARLLLESSKTEKGVRFVPERLTQAEIASRVGCSREMVSRILKDLVQGRYITVLAERIVINREPPARS